jgi:hypothetical protein
VGTRTALAIVVADALGLPLEAVTILVVTTAIHHLVLPAAAQPSAASVLHHAAARWMYSTGSLRKRLHP